MINKRTCPKCKIEKELISSNFGKNKSEIGGFQYTCKECHKTHYKRKYNPKHNNPSYNLKYKNLKYQNNIEYRLLVILRNRVHQYLTKSNCEDSIDFLGCTIKFYKKYIEEKFDIKMNWENYGTYWEIDHIIPLSKNGSFHYTNTQPLTINQNRIKSNN
jgi:hypothetical protein